MRVVTALVFSINYSSHLVSLADRMAACVMCNYNQTIARFLMTHICSASVPHTRQLSKTSTLLTDSMFAPVSRSLTTTCRLAASPSNHEFAAASDTVDDDELAPGRYHITRHITYHRQQSLEDNLAISCMSHDGNASKLMIIGLYNFHREVVSPGTLVFETNYHITLGRTDS